MGKCVIFCAGGFSGLLEPVAGGDYIIAADGGYAHVRALGLTPNCLLGDFDSLGYVPDKALVYPTKKDDTDAMLAVRRGLELGYQEFVLYGTLDGPRLDHTVANVQLLHFLASHGATGWLVGNAAAATVIQNRTARFPATATGYFSVFCLGARATGITLSGAEYTLENGTLTPDFPLGASNRFCGKPARISVKDGALLLIWDRENGLCEVTDEE
jgi:thiamine pyrophosphokinase